MRKILAGVEMTDIFTNKLQKGCAQRVYNLSEEKQEVAGRQKI